jgi:EAL domain-containing protein (putative c-di-GMP-specific phosphodiesterase class I)
LILPIGEWVLETACRQLSAWAARDELRHLTISVNVSARQFRQSSFVGQVQDILAASGADPQLLKLELTESLMVNSVQETVDKMDALHALGVSFSLDDFGTGYSSLSYLQRLPLNQLKIDQSFVRDILVDGKDAAIAQTVVHLAQDLGLSVMAEGVESQAQRDFLERIGCHAFQGHLFGRPVPLAEFEQLLLAGVPEAL